MCLSLDVGGGGSCKPSRCEVPCSQHSLLSAGRPGAVPSGQRSVERETRGHLPPSLLAHQTPPPASGEWPVCLCTLTPASLPPLSQDLLVCEGDVSGQLVTLSRCEEYAHSVGASHTHLLTILARGAILLTNHRYSVRSLCGGDPAVTVVITVGGGVCVEPVVQSA